MFFRKYPYWLRGGLIASGLYLLFIAASFLLALIGLEIFGNSAFIVISVLFFPVIILILFFDIPYLGACAFQGFGDPKIYQGCPSEVIIGIFYFIFSLFIYFLVGLMIGWTIGKIKNIIKK